MSNYNFIPVSRIFVKMESSPPAHGGVSMLSNSFRQHLYADPDKITVSPMFKSVSPLFRAKFNPVQKVSFCGYVSAGLTGSFYDKDGLMVYLLKENAEGKLLWAKAIGDIEDVNAESLHQTDDGGYLLAGFPDILSGSKNKIYLHKTDIFGNEEWTRIYQVSEDARCYSVFQTYPNQEQISVGQTTMYDDTNNGIFRIRTGASNGRLNFKSSGNSSGHSQFSIHHTSQVFSQADGRTFPWVMVV